MNPFLPPCGHCLCYECALKLRDAELYYARDMCPICKGDVTDISKQPQLKELVEEYTAMLWPDSWTLLQAIISGTAPEMLSAVADFFVDISEEQVLALRLLRFSLRALADDADWSEFGRLALFPVIQVEEGSEGVPGPWSGMSAWMHEALTSEHAGLEAKVKFALQPVMRTTHATFATQLIPLFIEAQTSGACNLSLEDTRAMRSFVARHVGNLPGGWGAFADIRGAAFIAPLAEVASAFQATPTVKLLRLLSGALRGFKLLVGESSKTIRRVIARVSAGLKTALAAGEAHPAFRVSLLTFIGNVAAVLNDATVANEILGAAGLLPHVLHMRCPPPVLLQGQGHGGGAQQAAEDEQGSGKLTGKRRRA